MFGLNRFNQIFNYRFLKKFETTKGESILEIEIEKKSLHFGFLCNLIISNKFE